MEFIPGRPMLSANTTYTINPNELMAICFKDFLITDFSQTTTLRGEICSLKYILSNYSDKYEIRDAIKTTSQCATKVISGFTFLIKSESFVTSLIFGKKNLKLCLEAATACFLSLSMFRFLRSVFSVFRMVISEMPISVAFSTKNSENKL
jgi:hypothetical protein